MLAVSPELLVDFMRWDECQRLNCWLHTSYRSMQAVNSLAVNSHPLFAGIKCTHNWQALHRLASLQTPLYAASKMHMYTSCFVLRLQWAISNLLWCSDDSTRSAIWRQAPLLQLRQPAKAAKAAAASTSAAARRHMVPESANGAAAKPSSAAAEATADGPGCSCGWQQPPRIAEPLQGNPLWAAFQAQTKGPVIRKWSPYFDIYHR